MVTVRAMGTSVQGTVAGLVLCAFMVGASSAHAAPILFSQVSPINGHTYYVLDLSSWADAEAGAVALGGHLVTIRSQVENDWLMTTFGAYAPAPEGFWIGLNDAASEGVFAWTSGEELTFTNWNVGEPNGGVLENFVHVYGPASSGSSRWNDLYENNPWGLFPSIAEVTSPAAVPEPASLVLLGTGGLALVARLRRRKQNS